MAAPLPDRQAEQPPVYESNETRKEKRREQRRLYHEANREQIAARKNAAYVPAKRRVQYLQNHEANMARAARWRTNNPEQYQASLRCYREEEGGRSGRGGRRL